MSSSEWEEAVGPVPDINAAAPAAVVELYYPDVYEWVEDWLLPRYIRRRTDARWDRRWFENLEAMDRLEAMWRAWEFSRLQGMTGMSTYWINVFDPMIRELTASDGVFWYVDDYDTPDQKPVERNPMASDPVPHELRD